jgi:hypothetical protein
LFLRPGTFGQHNRTEPMSVTNTNFTVRLSDKDRKALARSAKRRQRTSGDTIRQLITEDDDAHKLRLGAARAHRKGGGK